MPNRFVWYDLMTTDTAAAQRFYGAVLGWQGHEAMAGYTLFLAGAVPAAGVMAIPEDKGEAGLIPCWNGYIGVADVDAEAARVVQEGGAIHHAPTDIPEVGRFAVVTDPQGTFFNLFTGPPDRQAPEVPRGTPGHVSWHELHAVDGAAAFDFYATHFGWTKADAMDMGPMGVYQMFAFGGLPAGGVLTRIDKSQPPHWVFYFSVPDIEQAAETVRAAGGQVVRGPQEVPGGERIIHALDPQGAFFALVGPAK